MSVKLPFNRDFIQEEISTFTRFSPSIQLSSFASAPAANPGWVEVTHLTLTLPRLAPEFHGYRLAQFSDIHMDRWMTPRHVSQVVDLVNQEQPDMVAVTGDFITHDVERYAPSLVAALSRLSALDGVLAIRGNHDLWAGGPEVDQIIQDSGMINLCNTSVSVRRGSGCLHFVGVDDYYEHADRLNLALHKVPASGAAVLLAHEPDFADVSAKTGRFDLQISGHTHGGQVDLPIFGRLFLPKYAKKYPCGLYNVDGMWVYTNRGLGTTHFPIRYNAKSEITIYTLAAPGIED